MQSRIVNFRHIYTSLICLIIFLFPQFIIFFVLFLFGFVRILILLFIVKILFELLKILQIILVNNQVASLRSFKVKANLFITLYKFITKLNKDILLAFLYRFCFHHYAWVLYANWEKHQSHKLCNICHKDRCIFFIFRLQVFCFSSYFLIYKISSIPIEGSKLKPLYLDVFDLLLEGIRLFR